MYSENIRRNDHYWTYDEKQVHLESQLDPAKQTLISPHVEQFIDDKADIINGDDVRKTFVSSKLFAKKSIWCGNIFGSSAASAHATLLLTLEMRQRNILIEAKLYDFERRTYSLTERWSSVYL